MDFPGSSIVDKVSGLAVDALGRQVGYVIKYKQNLDNLKAAVQDLHNTRGRLMVQVREAEDRDEDMYDDVPKWLGEVDEIYDEANTLLGHMYANQAKVKCGSCPNPIYRHKLSRKSAHLAQSIVELLGKGEFPGGVSHSKTREERQTTSAGEYQVLESRTKMVENIMEKLRGLETKMIGVYGIGGVGKTTLVEEVFRQAKEEQLFRDVIMVQVNQNPDLERIQKEIAQTLGLKVDSDTRQGRQSQIHSRIKDKKTLVILDDFWGTFDLKAVGIPNVPNCKILLTSRSAVAFSSDEILTQTNFQLDLLEEGEAWKLFEKTAGDIVKDVAILSVAQEIAKKCGRLPVLIRTVAGSLRQKMTLDSWNDAMRRLESFKSEDLATNTYLALRWSYSELGREDLKQLFLLCAITARGN